jgi:hypothetical protein
MSMVLYNPSFNSRFIPSAIFRRSNTTAGKPVFAFRGGICQPSELRFNLNGVSGHAVQVEAIKRVWHIMPYGSFE